MFMPQLELESHSFTAKPSHHPFAKGNQKNKLPPREPYSLGGHNQRTENANIAKFNREWFTGSPQFKVRPVKRRHEKRAIAAYEAKLGNLSKLPRAARKLVLQWHADEIESIDRRMLRNAV